LVKPCGVRFAEAVAAARTILPLLPRAWPAVRSGRVYATDGNAFFNRPGPRLVESAEILAACLHPERCPDLLQRHREHLVRVEAS
jgi:iron complex transport system substrate-binding protein